MTLALPCLGMDALSAGLREIGWDGFEIAYAYDIDESLVPVLLHMHGPHANLHIGSRRGDFLACDVDELPRVDFIVAGPPCPPFSGQQVEYIMLVRRQLRAAKVCLSCSRHKL